MMHSAGYSPAVQDWKRIMSCLIPGFPIQHRSQHIHSKGMDVIAMIKKSSRIKYSY